MDLLLTLALSTAVQFLLFLYLRGRIEQQLNATDLLKNVQTEVDAMVRELNMSAERNIGVLEARLAEMESLLNKADQKVLVLSKELERRDRSVETYTQLKKTLPDILPAAPKPTVSETVSEPPPVSVPVPVPVAELPPPKTLRQRVIDLRVSGQTASEIAVATGVTQGEVELILSLHQDQLGQSFPSR